MSSRYNILRRIEMLDPQRDHQEIVFLSGAYEYPWLTQKAMEFAMFRTYGVPQMSRTLDQSGQFTQHGQKRYDDTTLVITEFIENGYESERGKKAIERMNALHKRFKIPNRNFLYVLSTFIFEPIRWHERYGWREVTEQEKLAIYTFWCEVGTRMGIRDIPDTYKAFEQYNIDHEQQYFAYDDANRNIADATMTIYLNWYPSILRPMIRQVLYSFMDAPLREAFGYPKANPIIAFLADKGLQIVGKVMRFLPPRQTLFRYTQQPNRTYPQGYEIETLGPSDASTKSKL